MERGKAKACFSLSLLNFWTAIEPRNHKIYIFYLTLQNKNLICFSCTRKIVLNVEVALQGLISHTHSRPGCTARQRQFLYDSIKGVLT